MEIKLTDQEIIRREKITKLQELGVNPFGQKFEVLNNSKDLLEKYNEFSKEELEEKQIFVQLAGRVVLNRNQGKAGFMHILDRYGKIQLYIKKDNIEELDFNVWKLTDLGDFIGVYGQLFKTHTNELTIKVLKYTFLSKALKPLPEKYHGLQDKEEGRRKRYLDLITSTEAKNTAVLRAKAIRAFQNFFDSKNYIEVETPVLQPILGGAAARPFVTHHNALDMDFYLRIATEIPLKKLIVGGLEKVYEIGRLFRNEGMDSTHNPEFTTLEAYTAYSDMYGQMDLVENCLKFVVEKTVNKKVLTFQEFEINFEKPFERYHMVDLINKYSGVNFFEITDFEKAKEIAKQHEVEVEKHFKLGHIINAFFEKYCEDKLLNPTFVYGHPLEISPLAKKNEEDPRFTDRFELFILGKEYANAYSELNDPIDQRERFENQLIEKENGNQEASEMDYDFIEALEQGMPPTGGLGIGIDRFVMLLTNQSSIRDVILFPHLKKRD